jgi:hypothetical protein
MGPPQVGGGMGPLGLVGPRAENQVFKKKKKTTAKYYKSVIPFKYV